MNRYPIFIAVAKNYLVAVVAMKRKNTEIRFQVVTTFFASEQSRHRKQQETTSPLRYNKLRTKGGGDKCGWRGDHEKHSRH